MRVILGVLAAGFLLALGACTDDAVKGTEAANACTDVICPPGTTRDQTASASSSCSGGGSVSVDVVGQDGSAATGVGGRRCAVPAYR